MNEQKGFTLLELLACVAVITLLVALAMPALANAKAKAKRIQCASNERQIALGLRLYVEDSAGCYPCYAASMNMLGESTNRPDFWDAKLLPYASAGVFLCPAHADSASNNWTLYYAGVAYPNNSYGYNAYGTEMAPNWQHVSPGLSEYWLTTSTPRYVRECRLATPSDMAALADYDTTRDDDGDGDPNPQWLYPLTLSGRWHAGSAMSAFCDGHAECRKLSVWLAERERWNNNHQPRLNPGSSR
jgi:prepilin-type N-terminal cleavage/methylation domain-containing protein/prepilin-type processing-associated H-X9-DG protein